ncbi:TonB-dependent receptor [Paremcibacter congregatus]|uniref:TonB-dependent receptor n=1 Tax=Paremcibacter congregatus TaxID=2043170 RepID=UPI0030EF8D36
MVYTPQKNASSKTSRLITSVSFAALLLSPTSSAFAVEDETIGFEEIVVTATKRGAQDIQSVAMSVSALGESTLKDMGVSDFDDYAYSVPGLYMIDQGPGDKLYLMRGVGSSASSAVGIYLDEAVLTGNNPEDGGGRNVDIKVYDMQQIEALRGPQGTLYGASSFGGTIKMITNKPNPSATEGYVDGTLSQTKDGGTNYIVHGMVNLPIVEDKFAVRVVGWHHDESGFIDNLRLSNEDYNTEKTTGLRTMLRFEPNEKMSLTAMWVHQQMDIGGRQRFFHEDPKRAAIPLADGSTVDNTEYQGDLVNGDYILDASTDNSDIYSITLDYDFDTLKLTAASSYFDREVNYWFDSTPILVYFGLPVPAYTNQPQQRSIWSNEIRLASDYDGPVNFVVGALYAEEKRDWEVRVATVGADGAPTGPWVFGPDHDYLGAGGTPFGQEPSFFHRTIDGKMTQTALFGEVTFDISDKLTAIAGMRYFDSNISETRQLVHGFGGPFNQPKLEDEASFNKTTFKGSLSYQATDNMMVFFTVAQGFRQGGLNPPGLEGGFVDTEIPTRYKSDDIVNYELGIKTEGFDGRLTFNATVYHTDWDDIQAREYNVTPFIVNAGAGRVNGFELESAARPMEGLTLTGMLSYTDAKITETQTIGDSGVEFRDSGRAGDPFFNVPKWNLNLAAQKDFPVTNELDGMVRVDFSHVGKTRTKYRADHPYNQNLAAYSLMNLRAGVRTENWQVMLFVNNLLNTRAEINKVYFEQEDPATFTNRPRTIGVNASYNF